MAYSEQQRLWLETVTKSAIAGSEKALEESANKTKGQELIRARLDGEKDMIRTAFESVNLKVKSKGLEGVVRTLFNRPAEMKLMDPKHDPMKELDTWHDLPAVAEVDEAELKILTENYRKIIALSEELRKNPYYAEPDKPEPPPEPSTPKARKDYKTALESYDKAVKEARRRLAEDLYKPLEREGVLPENFVPSAYSEVKRQFDEANALYEDKLKEYSKSLGEHGAFLQKFGDAMAIGKGLLKTATAGAGLAGAIGDLTANTDVVKNVKEAEEILEWIEVGLTSFEGVVNGALQERDGIAVADSLNAMLGKTLEGLLPEAAATLVNGAVEVAIRSASTGRKLAAGDIEGALEELGSAIAEGLGAVDPDGGAVAAIGSAIQGGLTGLAKLPDVARKVKAGDYRGALSVVIQNLDSVVDKAKGPASDWAKEIDEQVAALEGDVNVIAAQNQIINSQIDQDALKAQADRAAELQAENFTEFMRQQDRGFEEALAFGFAAPADTIEEQMQAEAKRLESLEKILAVHRRNEMMFELSKKILIGGPEFLAKAVPGMSLVAAATQLAYSIAEAVKSAQQLLIWADNMADAQKASTAQVDAIFNRYGLQKKQTIMANIKVALDAVKVAGEATKLAGQAAPAGFVITAAADSAEALMEVSAKVVEVAEMNKAWAVYKKALANPQDRKLAREAMRRNPTLSKYAMAWGAVEDGNPIAKECMRRCGLNERTLAQSNLQVGAVVDYLQTIYKEDPELLRSVVDEEKWHPGEVDFSFRSFLRFYQAAVKDAGLQAFDFSGVSAAMSAYEEAAEAFRAAQVDAQRENARIVKENAAALSAARKQRQADRKKHDQDRKAGKKPPALPAYADPDPMPYVEVEPTLMTAAVNAAGQAMVALGRLKPKTADGGVHTSFARYADAMAARARLARDDLDAEWEKQEWLPA